MGGILNGEHPAQPTKKLRQRHARKVLISWRTLVMRRLGYTISVFFFCGGGGGLAKGCEKSRDLRSNLKVDPGFVSGCCFMFFLWGTFLGCNFILSQYMSHKYEIPWLCHTVGEKIPANQLICWFLWISHSPPLQLAPEAISEDKLPGVLFPFFFFGYFLRLKPCPRWKGFMDCTARMWSDDANPCCFFSLKWSFFERRVHISMMGIDMNQCTQNGKELGKLWEKFEPSSAGGDLIERWTFIPKAFHFSESDRWSCNFMELQVIRFMFYMGVSLNGGTPKNTPTWSFIVGKPMVVSWVPPF